MNQKQSPAVDPNRSARLLRTSSMAALTVVLLAAAALVVRQTTRATAAGMAFDPDHPIAVRCSACGRDFSMPYGAYKAAIDSRRDLDRGIRCSRCGAEKSVWRSWAEHQPNAPKAVPSQPESRPDQTPEPARTKRPMRAVG